MGLGRNSGATSGIYADLILGEIGLQNKRVGYYADIGAKTDKLSFKILARPFLYKLR